MWFRPFLYANCFDIRPYHNLVFAIIVSKVREGERVEDDSKTRRARARKLATTQSLGMHCSEAEVKLAVASKVKS